MCPALWEFGQVSLIAGKVQLHRAMLDDQLKRNVTLNRLKNAVVKNIRSTVFLDEIFEMKLCYHSLRKFA